MRRIAFYDDLCRFFKLGVGVTELSITNDWGCHLLFRHLCMEKILLDLRAPGDD